MIRNYRLTIEYDGTAFHGWQKQKEDRTVQGEIEAALQVMTGKKTVVNGSGRTDAGVHAHGQVANFKSEVELNPGVFLKGLNSLLPEDVVIQDCRYADEQFHARYDVKRKCYEYRILNRDVPSPLLRRYVWFIRQKLDVTAMMQAARALVGSHDFKSFEGSGSPRSSTVRIVFEAELHPADTAILVFRIEADGFLRFMVRNIMGTLVDVGRGKLSPEMFAQILASKDRGLAGATAPPQGLFLMKVIY
jgi:tRNA pseudouridine38-40 synthase